MSRVLAVMVLVLLTLPSQGEEKRVRIPDGCRELADRAGLPLELTRAEIARAVAYLRVMSGKDPAVRRCRLAVLRF
jgi:hypothetical protein